MRGQRHPEPEGQRFLEQSVSRRHLLKALAALTAAGSVVPLASACGPAKGSALCGHLTAQADPLAALESAGAMALVPPRSKGFFAGFVGSDLERSRGRQSSLYQWQHCGPRPCHSAESIDQVATSASCGAELFRQPRSCERNHRRLAG